MATAPLTFVFLIDTRGSKRELSLFIFETVLIRNRTRDHKLWLKWLKLKPRAHGENCHSVLASIFIGYQPHCIWLLHGHRCLFEFRYLSSSERQKPGQRQKGRAEHLEKSCI